LEAADGVFTVSLWDDAEMAADQPTEAGAERFIGERVKAVTAEEAPKVADTYDKAWAQVVKAWDDGELPYTETGRFFSYLRFNMGVPILTGAMITGGVLAAYLLKYAQENGFHPAKEPTFHYVPSVRAPTPHYAEPPPKPVSGPVAPTTAPTPHYAKPPPKPVSGPVAPTTAPTPHYAKPPVEVTGTAPAAAKAPTRAQRVVAHTARQVVPQQVTAPGLTKAEAAAISKAIGAATADMLRAQAAVIDAMLPGMAPGQVPEMLQQLSSTTTVLELEVRQLQVEIGVGDLGSLPGTLTNLRATLTALQRDVSSLTDELATKAPSALETLINDIGDRVDHDTNLLHDLEVALPGLATVTELGALSGRLTKAIEDEGSTYKAELEQAVSPLRTEVQTLTKTAEELDECCEENSNITNPIRSGGATPSLLKQLGSLLKTAVEGVFIAGVLDSVMAVLDLPVVITTTVIETEALTNWAETSAGIIGKDLSWLGKLDCSG
jgi:hypothetical protein